MAKNELDDFCRQAFKLLADAQVPHLVIGGLAVMVVGEPRTTGDVDVLVYLNAAQANAFLRRAKKNGFDLDVKTEAASIQDTGTFCLRRGRFHLDVILASLPFEDVAYRRAETKKLFGRKLKFPTPEDLILLKVLVGAPKDMLDAVGVARRHSRTLDRKYIEKALRPLCDLAEDMSAWNRLQQVLAETGLRPDRPR